VTDYPDIFDSLIVPKLNGNDVKFFYDVNTESRVAIKRSSGSLRPTFKICDFFTKSTLSWALEECSEKKERFCVEMALSGNLVLLQYLHVNGCPWSEWTCSSAAWDIHLECLKYLHENGCPWDKWTCRAAAENGHLECLKYLHDKGCPESENYELCKYEDLECKYKKLEEENEKLKEKIERLETKVRHLS
jgi:hypothetical protein